MLTKENIHCQYTPTICTLDAVSGENSYEFEDQFNRHFSRNTYKWLYKDYFIADHRITVTDYKLITELRVCMWSWQWLW